MRLSKVIAVLLTLSIAAVPEVVAAQSLEQLTKQGDEAWKAGNYAQAEVVWRQYLQGDPNNVWAYLNLGRALSIQGKRNAAVDAYRQATRLKPNLAYARYHLGQELYAQNGLNEAISAFRKAIQLKPDYAEAYVSLGNALDERKDFNAAFTAYHQAIQLNPKLPEAYYNLGVALSRQGRFNEAIAAYRKTIELEPNAAIAYGALSSAFNKLGNLTEAVNASHKAIQLAPRFTQAYVDLGNALYELGNLNEAVDTYRQAIQLQPDAADAYNGLGVVLIKKAKTLPQQNFENRQQVDEVLDWAIRSLRQAIQLQPDDAIPYSNLGLALNQRGKFDEAIKSYKKAIQLNPRYAEAYLGLASSLFKLDKFDGAVTAIRQAIQLKPDDADAYHNLGIVLTEQSTTMQNPEQGFGSWTVPHDFELLDKAIDALHKAIQIEPNDARTYRSLGSAFEKRGKFKDAISAYRKAIKIDPNLIEAYAGLSVTPQGKTDEAAKINEEIIRRQPDNEIAYLNLCNEYWNQNKLDQAINACRQVLTLLDKKGNISSFERGSAYDNLGQLLMKQGKLEEAIKHFENAIQAGAIDFTGENSVEENLKEAQRMLALQKNPKLATTINTPYVVSSAQSTLLRRAVVQVLAAFPDGRTASGTGFVVKRQGNETWILTNRHVVFDEKDASSLKIQLYFNNLSRGASPPPPYRADLVKRTVPNDGADLALLKVISLPADIQPLLIASEDVKDNTDILVLGSSDTSLLTNQGKVIDVTGNRLFLRIAVSKGSSGSPVLAGDRVVGMVYRTTAGGDQELSDVAYAVPSRLIVEKLEEWNFRLPRFIVLN